jgi:hypothetical protein
MYFNNLKEVQSKFVTGKARLRPLEKAIVKLSPLKFQAPVIVLGGVVHDSRPSLIEKLPTVENS